MQIRSRNRLGNLLLTLAGSLLVSGAAAVAAPKPETIYDLWIRNGTIVDGTGRERFAGDVLISGDTIAYVGSTAGRKIESRRTIEARGKLVTRGISTCTRTAIPRWSLSVSSSPRGSRPPCSARMVEQPAMSAQSSLQWPSGALPARIVQRIPR